MLLWWTLRIIGLFRHAPTELERLPPAVSNGCATACGCSDAGIESIPPCVSAWSCPLSQLTSVGDVDTNDRRVCRA